MSLTKHASSHQVGSVSLFPKANKIAKFEFSSKVWGGHCGFLSYDKSQTKFEDDMEHHPPTHFLMNNQYIKNLIQKNNLFPTTNRILDDIVSRNVYLS